MVVWTWCTETPGLSRELMGREEPGSRGCIGIGVDIMGRTLAMGRPALIVLKYNNIVT